VRGSVALTLVLASVISISSCKKDVQVTPEKVPASVTNSNYKVSQPISLNGVHDMTISGDSISGGALSCISLVNCYNIHITHCKLVNSSVNGVNLTDCNNIIVDDCSVANVSTGVYSFNSRSISVMNNLMKNISGTSTGGTMVAFENLGNNTEDASTNSAINNQEAQ